MKADKEQRGFIMRPRFRVVVDRLTIAQRGELLTALFAYFCDGEELTSDDIALQIAFDVMREQIDYDTERYERVVERRREAGRKGGLQKSANLTHKKEENEALPNATFANQMLPNATFANQNVANVANTNTISIPISNTNVSNETNKKEKNINVLKESDESGAVLVLTPEEAKPKRKPREARPADLDAAIAYFSTLGMPREEAEAFYDHFESNGWKVGGKAAMKDWHAAARTWKRNRKARTSYQRETATEFAEREEQQRHEQYQRMLERYANGNY